jgi:hypothetical protein
MLSKPDKIPTVQTNNEKDHAVQGQVPGQNQELSSDGTRTAVDDEVVITGASTGAGTQGNEVQQQLSSQQGGLDVLGNDFDFAHLDSMYSYELLFGTGLPQEFVSTDWPSYEAMIQ